MDMLADIIIGLQHGDEGKGKITHHLCKNENYTHVVRYNGGCNAGHTIYHDGKKFITHHIPAGVFFGVKSIIGSGCVLNINQFFKELKELKAGGVETSGLIFVAKNTHIITQDHLEEDSRDTKIGTTKSGNGPAYRDKFDRKGIRAEEVEELQPYLIDLYDEFHKSKQEKEIKILFEGAQGFGLDVDWGDYPYVTSSNCITAAALMNGVPPQAVRKVWGVAKAYGTYVGAKKFQGESKIFNKIQEAGDEFGATTGRKRQCNWTDWSLLKRAIDINGVTDLVFNKFDILNQIGKWAIVDGKTTHHFDTEHDMQDWILYNTGKDINVYFSRSKDRL
jgi:adenylosuccinate synthase